MINYARKKKVLKDSKREKEKKVWFEKCVEPNGHRAET
jgi:hypothetical protein